MALACMLSKLWINRRKCPYSIESYTEKCFNSHTLESFCEQKIQNDFEWHRTTETNKGKFAVLYLEMVRFHRLSFIITDALLFRTVLHSNRGCKFVWVLNMRIAHATHNTRHKILYRSKHDTFARMHGDTHAYTDADFLSLWMNVGKKAKRRAEHSTAQHSTEKKNAETEKEIFNPRLSTFPHLDNR